MLGLTSSSYSFRLPFGRWGFAESRVLAKATRMAIPHEGRSHVEHLNKPTAYGDGLRGLRNTDVTDAHGSFITDLLFFLFFSFDGPLGLRILNGFSAYQASPVMWHTSIHITLRRRKIRVDLPRRRRDLCY